MSMDERIAPVLDAIEEQLGVPRHLTEGRDRPPTGRPALVVREPIAAARKPEPADYAPPRVRAAQEPALPPPSPLSAEAEALRMKEELDAVMKVRDDGKAKAAAATAEMAGRERALGEFLDGIVTMTEARLAEQARRHAALRGYYEGTERLAAEAGLVVVPQVEVKPSEAAE